MNKLLIVSALLLSSSMVQAAGYRLVSSDNSELSALCIKAAETKTSIVKSARAIGMQPEEISELRCNGQPLPVFLSKFRNNDNSVTADYGFNKNDSALLYTFNKNDNSELTELCYAAVRSEQEYEQVKDAYFNDEQNIEEEVRCNGMPLKNFARKYRNRAFTASTR